ncbi:MAG: chain-length determining protein [Pseudomonadota bacterium]
MTQEIELEPLEQVEEPNREPGPFNIEYWSRWFTRNRGYVAFVIVPTLLAAIYFAFIAADRYVAEAHFVVRSPSTAAASQLTSLVQGSGIVRSSDDAYIVHAYMQSRDAVRTLTNTIDLVARLQRPEADLLWKYPGLIYGESEERLWKHFQGHLSIEFDSTTGISTMSVQAFRPEDAREIAEGLLVASENLINAMSERAKTELMATANEELELMRAQSQAVVDKITDFRRENQLIDPSQASKAALQAITELSLGIARTRAELKELELIAADSPQAMTLRRRIVAFQEQTYKEREALAGTQSSLPPLIADYERLLLEREFAERSFASARSAYDIARIESERQRLFIERISTPSTPDYPEYPYRLLMVLASFLCLSMIYLILKYLFVNLRAHGAE